MTRLDGKPVLTAAELREAEARAMRRDVTEDDLIARAGAAVADWVRRLAVGAETLVLCGPGNNGADGYVAAALLRENGHPVRVAAAAPPRSPAAIRAAERWGGPIEPLACFSAPVLVDAVYGTGLTRPLDQALRDALIEHRSNAGLSIAVDLPSGLHADLGRTPGWVVPDIGVSLTLALGALKPAHILWPGSEMCGTVRLVDLGLRPSRAMKVASRPGIPRLWGTDHKFTRGMVAVVAGAMPGAARLAATAAARAGAGYVVLLGDEAREGPDAIVHRALDEAAFDDERIGAVVIGPGLGRDDRARHWVDHLLSARKMPLVLDGDALHLVDGAALRPAERPLVLTPHDGEFRACFPYVMPREDRITETRLALGDGGFTLVRKGVNTMVMSPGHTSGGVATTLFPTGNLWLSTAGSGDVLAGAIGGLLARFGRAQDAAEAGVWLHADAARRCGASFIADDLAAALTPARAGL
jgi:hydroxyethylthiazole kinase-like uncharacterized protein yjeF